MKKLWVPLIIGLLGCAILCGLGIWQIQRLHWKENLIAELEARMTQQPLQFSEIKADDLQNLSGTPIIMRGVFADGYTDLLSGSATSAGYRRIVPFETNNMRVMVELGFLPEAQANASFTLPDGEYEIRGHIYVPEHRSGTYDANRNIWVGYNLEGMAELLKAEPVLVAASNSPIKELEDTPMTIDLPNNHLQYAITWFSLAAVWAAMSVYWGYRRTKEESK